jgi:hypothetical protein
MLCPFITTFLKNQQNRLLFESFEKNNLHSVFEGKLSGFGISTPSSSAPYSPWYGGVLQLRDRTEIQIGSRSHASAS